ncbi:Aerobic respiration control sensor protein ArcB [Aquisphaera giovannonii]|uniref:histidine kinase n=1 Tax=Aquisphaera giovannonii TaxID=406548 RepID=A0A5B9WCK7_9BACT|nr:ATP-binding protein [Aquisphaera giovannonii]QEH38408.1 Aerobic respiration control sensor protein ArcB [Aquisphaera giovannonii]
MSHDPGDTHESLIREAGLFRYIVESAAEYAIFATDQGGRIVSWNTGAERILGYSESEILGQDARILFTPEDRARRAPEQEMERAAAEGRAANERWHVRKDGSRFWGSGLTMPLMEGPSNAPGFVKIFRDKTEQRRALEAQRESEDRYRLLFNSIDEGFCVIEVLHDDDGLPADYRFLEVNPAFERHTGLREATGRRVRDLVPGLEAHWYEVYSRVAETGEPVRFENEARALGGRWFDVYAFRIGEPSQRRVAVLFTDVTGRRELERSLRHRARELAEADHRKNEFLAMLAHELRNPLSAIHSAVQVARDPRATVEMLPQSLGVIERQAKNLARLIDDLLDVARITQGKVVLKREPVDLVAVIGRAAQAVRPLIEQKRHRFTFHHDFGPMPVDADPTRLEQVVGNLLTNAAKYTEPGGSVSVSAGREGAEAVVRVKDDGVGIPPDMLPKVFELFTQVDPTLARSEGGLGIGLSLVKQLVEMHGGTVSAASEPGRGSEFTVRLPLLESATPAQEPAPGAAAPGRNGRLLVVDDNVDTARLTGRLLELMGFDVLLCHDGRRALEVARQYRPEAILLDIGLPGMNGFEVARQIREDPCCRDSLIVGVSGYGDARSREQALEAGFDHHLVKPVDISAVAELVSRPR